MRLACRKRAEDNQADIEGLALAKLGVVAVVKRLQKFFSSRFFPAPGYEVPQERLRSRRCCLGLQGQTMIHDAVEKEVAGSDDLRRVC